VLWWASQVMKRGEDVLWLDEEMGPRDVANRLLLLGVDPETVRAHLAYLPFPEMTLADKDEWIDYLASRQFALVVFDAGADFFSAADVDENSGVEVTRWVKAFCDPVRQREGTPVVIDHVTKKGGAGGYAVGSRAKKAKAKMAWEADRIQEFDPDTRGLVRFERVKDNLGTDAPRFHDVQIGGDPFVLSERAVPERETPEQKAARKLHQNATTVERVMQKAREVPSKVAILDLAGGNRNDMLKAIDWAVASPLYKVHSYQDDNDKIRYRFGRDEGGDEQ
jgi:hypothetical protein